MIGWIDSMLTDGERESASKRGYDWGSSMFVKAKARMNALNYPPSEVGRGLSETLSIPSEDLNDTFEPFIDTVDGRLVTMNADFDNMIVDKEQDETP